MILLHVHLNLNVKTRGCTAKKNVHVFIVKYSIIQVRKLLSSSTDYIPLAA